MLPTEPPLSLHRLVAPVPPVRTPEAGAAAHQGKPAAVVPVPVPVGNASVANAAGAPGPAGAMLLAGHDQTGNAAVAKAALHAAPAPPVAVIAPKAK
ncbi:hypothetical protein ACFS5L_24605 [Streptomyces phyllanthi]|uniref:Uncharacterized protein n=1 Tax=Streptomyces phyllanthi TaxID=1803180 RepID=A0A5N8WFT6_9ACTN|nr:hypothetical protein [Streptomyces phyllanthi]MPY45716.1 hypothetical protein [Streptomyces phyllanthi]